MRWHCCERECIAVTQLRTPCIIHPAIANPTSFTLHHSPCNCSPYTTSFAPCQAQKQASVGGDGTQGANTSQMDKMVFNSDPHCGVWGNEDGFQVAMGHYTKFLGDHPVWGATAIEKQHPIVVDRSLPNFNQKAWWPGEKTTLYQYCNCTTKKESAQYGKQRVRR